MTTLDFKNGNYFMRMLSGILLVVVLLLQTFDADAQRRYNARKENTSLALGTNTTYQIINGKLWAWGRNNYGQFGNGTTTASYTPVQIGTATDWMSITAGIDFAVALKANGTLWSWGHNDFGQLGDGTILDHSTPQQVGNDTWLTVSAAGNHVAALKADGTLWTWGRNLTSLLIYSISPVKLNNDKWVYIATAPNNTFAIKADGALYGWGDDTYNQLYGWNSVLHNPLLDSGSWLSVAAAERGVTAIRHDGSLWTVGSVRGDGTEGIRNYPIRIGLDTWSNIAVGYQNNTFGIKTDGTLWVWGDNFPAALGDGTWSYRNTPYQINADRWVNVVAGGRGAGAIKEDGTLWMWGFNSYGEVGDGTNTMRLSPVNITTGSSLNSWQVLASGFYHSAGIKSDGTLWTWGLNDSGQLGDGAMIDRNCPVQIGTSKWLDVSAGISHTIAIKADGTLWAWGYNGYGQLGTGTYTNQSSPVQIGTDKWIAVSAGNTHTAAIRADGRLFTWGYNDYGKLGDNTTTQRLVPTLIGIYTWVKVTAGAYHTAAIASDGSLWTFGFNGAGILGDGTTIDRHAPVKIGNDSWVSVSAGEFHTHAIKADGTLHSWGYNEYGHLGDGTVTYRTSPVQIGNETWRFISTSKYAGGAAIRSNGTLLGWGTNEYGQIGDGTNSLQLSPVSIAELIQFGDETDLPLSVPTTNITNTNWLIVAAGYQSTIAIKAERTSLYSTGTNGHGQMGRNVVASSAYGINTTGVFNTSPVDMSLASNRDICTGHSTTMSVGAIGGRIAWYNTPSGGSPLMFSPNYSTPALTATTTYYVQSTAYCTTANERTPITVTVNSCARLAEEGEFMGEGDMRVFPNPSVGACTVMGNKAGIYTIVNELGQTVQTLELNDANSYTVEINHLNKGVYSIVGPDRATQRIVVLK